MGSHESAGSRSLIWSSSLIGSIYFSLPAQTIVKIVLCRRLFPSNHADEKDALRTGLFTSSYLKRGGTLICWQIMRSRWWNGGRLLIHGCPRVSARLHGLSRHSPRPRRSTFTSSSCSRRCSTSSLTVPSMRNQSIGLQLLRIRLFYSSPSRVQQIPPHDDRGLEMNGERDRIGRPAIKRLHLTLHRNGQRTIIGTTF